MTASPERTYPRQESKDVALRGVCPRCGTGKLFKGTMSLGLRDRCASCGLDHSHVEIGDGAAVPVLLLANLLLVALALWFHFSWGMPIWLNILICAPVAVAVVMWTSKFMKAFLYAQTYKHEAAQGRLSR